MRELPKVGRHYRLILNKPAREAMVIFVNPQGDIVLNGFESIPGFYGEFRQKNGRKLLYASSVLSMLTSYKEKKGKISPKLTSITDAQSSTTTKVIKN